ncbi:MAG TPA: quinone-dependent dihydroorotate dehydrogenase [Drouetiella sp.]
MYDSLVRPILFKMDPEGAHVLAHSLAPLLKLTPLKFEHAAANLHTKLSGTELKNPVGLAAGFDKNGKLIDIIDRLGFGFMEIGSVCALPTQGNPKPRLFRLPDDEAVINRLGLNGEGAHAVAERLGGEHVSFRIPTGLNIAKTNLPEVQGDRAVTDVVSTFDCFKAFPFTYVAFNASCPNTHEGILNERQQLTDIIREVQQKNVKSLPIFIKMSPDSPEPLIEDIIEIANSHNVSGFICGNTTTTRDGLKTDATQISQIGNGGLSGKPLKNKALSLLKRVAKLKNANQEIIACGGIASGQDAYDFLEAGAKAVQLYTALVYHGPSLVATVNRDLSALLKNQPLEHLLR